MQAFMWSNPEDKNFWELRLRPYKEKEDLPAFKEVLLNHYAAWGIFTALMTTAGFGGFLLVPSALDGHDKSGDWQVRFS
jgi:hypothetical protein